MTNNFLHKDTTPNNNRKIIFAPWGATNYIENQAVLLLMFLQNHIRLLCFGSILKYIWYIAIKCYISNIPLMLMRIYKTSQIGYIYVVLVKTVIQRD